MACASKLFLEAGDRCTVVALIDELVDRAGSRNSAFGGPAAHRLFGVLDAFDAGIGAETGRDGGGGRSGDAGRGPTGGSAFPAFGNPHVVGLSWNCHIAGGGGSH